MKILLCIRSDYLSNPADDTTLVMQTAKYLQSRGAEITVNCGQYRDYSDYDTVHLFNLTRISETYAYFCRARRQRKPVVITPIYWDLSRFYHYSRCAEDLRQWKAYAPFRREIPPMEQENYILCAARICPRKNQLALAKAAYRLGVNLYSVPGEQAAMCSPSL